MDRVQDQAPPLAKEEKRWIEKNLAEQSQRHENIVAEMARIAPERETWVNTFLERIQTLGFNYNCDLRRKIPEEEIPKQPKRPFKVVF